MGVHEFHFARSRYNATTVIFGSKVTVNRIRWINFTVKSADQKVKYQM